MLCPQASLYASYVHSNRLRCGGHYSHRLLQVAGVELHSHAVRRARVRHVDCLITLWSLNTNRSARLNTIMILNERYRRRITVIRDTSLRAQLIMCCGTKTQGRSHGGSVRCPRMLTRNKKSTGSHTNPWFSFAAHAEVIFQ
jgi:hypothetical protein